MKAVKTPCIGVCSTVFGDEVCRGCKRFVHEVIDWNIYDDEQKLLVKKRLEDLSQQVLASKIRVVDETKFAVTINKVQVDAEQHQAILILELLRKAAKQIRDFSEHGLQVLPDYQHYSANALKELIDSEIHILATATYHKNFKSRVKLLPKDKLVSS